MKAYGIGVYLKDTKEIWDIGTDDGTAYEYELEKAYDLADARNMAEDGTDTHEWGVCIYQDVTTDAELENCFTDIKLDFIADVDRCDSLDYIEEVFKRENPGFGEYILNDKEAKKQEIRRTSKNNETQKELYFGWLKDQLYGFESEGE